MRMQMPIVLLMAMITSSCGYEKLHSSADDNGPDLDIGRGNDDGDQKAIYRRLPKGLQEKFGNTPFVATVDSQTGRLIIYTSAIPEKVSYPVKAEAIKSISTLTIVRYKGSDCTIVMDGYSVKWC